MLHLDRLWFTGGSPQSKKADQEGDDEEADVPGFRPCHWTVRTELRP